MSARAVISQKDAALLDEELMSEAGCGFTLDQLMELAGLAVACAVHDSYPPGTHPRVLVACGPGNNGGDGLVAARHLAAFGYRPAVVYPKRPARAPFQGLVRQLGAAGVPVSDAVGGGPFDVAVDALFGFGFRAGGGVRAPFDAVLASLGAGGRPVVSVDVPSGWDVESGPVGGGALRPSVLVSLSAPKPCSRAFEGGAHYLGGRFVPPAVARKYGIDGLPPYEGRDQVVRLS